MTVTSSNRDKRKFAKIEGILYDYPSFDNAIESLQVELSGLSIKHGTSVVNFSHDKPSGHSSPQESYTQKSCEIRCKIMRIQAKQRAVDTAMENMAAEDKRLVELTYFEKLPKWRVWTKLCLPRSTYFDKRNRIIKHFGKYLNIQS